MDEFIIPDCLSRPKASSLIKLEPKVKSEPMDYDPNPMEEQQANVVQTSRVRSNSGQQATMAPRILLTEGSAINIWNAASSKLDLSVKSLIHVAQQKVPVILSCTECCQHFRVMRRKEEVIMALPFKCPTCQRIQNDFISKTTPETTLSKNKAETTALRPPAKSRARPEPGPAPLPPLLSQIRPKVLKNKCNICGEAFEESAELLKHLYKHCVQNGDSTDSSKADSSSSSGQGNSKTAASINDNRRLKQTSKNENYVPVERHKCQICLTKFSTKKGLLLHQVSKHTHVKASKKKKKERPRKEGARWLPCYYCVEYFNKSLDRSKHIALEHQDRMPHKCSICGYGFSKKSALSLHHSVSHAAEVQAQSHDCNFCGETFTYVSSLMRHQRTKHKSTVPQREPQKKIASTLEKDVKTIMKLMQDCLHEAESDTHSSVSAETRESASFLYSLYGKLQTPFECGICRSRFGEQDLLFSHLTSRCCMEKNYKCQKCDEQFSRQIELVEHCKVHTAVSNKEGTTLEKEIKNEPECETQSIPKVIKAKELVPAVQLERLKLNELQPSTPQDLLKPSNTCTRTPNRLNEAEPLVASPQELAASPLTLSPPQTPSYAMNKRIKIEPGAELPANVHGNPNPGIYFQLVTAPSIPIQAQTFFVVPSQQPGAVPLPTEHQPIEKPFVCLTCGKSCARKSDLLKHSLTHNTGKRFKCEVCGLSFSYPKCFSKHVRSHSEETFDQQLSVPKTEGNEKPGHCLVCGQWYSSRLDLIAHSLDHTEEKPYKCSVCGQVFSYRKCFETHCKAHAFEDQDNGNQNYEDSTPDEERSAPATYLGTSTTNQLHLFNQSNVHSTCEANGENLLEVKLEYFSESSSDSLPGSKENGNRQQGRPERDVTANNGLQFSKT